MTFRRKLAWVGGLYVAEGMPFGIVRDVLPVYFRVHGVSLTEIGLLSLLGTPWTLKVLWSPLVDRFGQRQQWITGCLVTMVVLMALVPLFDPVIVSTWLWVVLLAFTVASATQDIAIDAYTISLLEPGEEGTANGVRVSAYRVALIVSGGGLVILAGFFAWPIVFLAAALLFAFLALGSLWAPRLIVPEVERQAWLAAMKGWLLRPGALAVLFFVLIYKLGDAAMGPMIKPFWLDRGLAIAEIGLVSTSVGVVATILGALVGGVLTSRWGIFRGLWVLGLAQALSNLTYAAVAWANPPLPVMAVSSLGGVLEAVSEPARAMIYAASIVESFTGGLGTAAFLAFLMHVCDKAHAAVQYALLSAVFAFSRDVVGAGSGWMTTRVGYDAYFLLTFFLALPAFGLLPFIKSWIHDRSGVQGSGSRVQGM